MKKNINIFIARTPLQLFNCIEARDRFHKDEQNILFYQYRSVIDKKQIENLIDSSWYEVVEYPLTLSNRLFFPISLSKIVSKYKSKVSSCYYGAYNGIISHLINSLNPTHKYLVDDGIKTIKISQFIKDNKLDKRGFLRPIKDWLLNSTREYIYQSKFFTVYDEIENHLPHRVVKNDYRAFKKRVSTMKREDIVYFIGTALLKRSIKTEEIFEQELERVIEYYQERNQKFIYILHRYEDIEYMNSLAKKYSFEAVRFDNIIEVELLRRGVVPSGVSSFASTAVETIDMIYGVEVKIFELDNSGIFEKYQKVFQDLYNNFREKGVDVIDSTNSQSN